MTHYAMSRHFTTRTVFNVTQKHILFEVIRLQTYGQKLHCLNRRKEIYLTTHSFYIRLYVIGHMVTDHSDSERGILLSPIHRLLFLIGSKGSFITFITELRLAPP